MALLGECDMFLIQCSGFLLGHASRVKGGAIFYCDQGLSEGRGLHGLLGTCFLSLLPQFFIGPRTLKYHILHKFHVADIAIRSGRVLVSLS